MNVSIEKLLSLRRELAAARANALQDAEGIAALLVAIEDVGAFYYGSYESLEQYRGPLLQKLMNGPGQQEFQKLFEVVKWNRNSGVHAGAWARHATTNAVELALLLEDALGRKIMQHDNGRASPDGGEISGEGKTKDQSDWLVEYFMVRDPVCAQPWHTIADIRRTMLRYSFGHLPIWRSKSGESSESGEWMLVSSRAVAEFLGSPSKRQPRQERGQKTVEEAIKMGSLSLAKSELLTCHDTWAEALKRTEEMPAMVVKDQKHPEQVLGIITAFDLM